MALLSLPLSRHALTALCALCALCAARSPRTRARAPFAMRCPQAAAALAALSHDTSLQKSAIKAGCIPPLVSMLSKGSAAAQAYAAQALANAAAYGAEEGQNVIAAAGAVPAARILSFEAMIDAAEAKASGQKGSGNSGGRRRRKKKR